MQPNTPYNPKNIEEKWAKAWDENKTYKSEVDNAKKKLHVLDMFPYPSGEGLHAGHAKIFGGSDIYTRYKRMQGYNVLHATGFDAFGLPAEQFAIKNRLNPKVSTKRNTDNFERQMKMIGFSYDYDRIINTTDPKFYKWTQWIFKQLYKKGLCYESHEPINWCPSCKTGLANEDLEDGKCERCGSVVEKKPLRQWVIRITEYAEKLLTGLNNLDWKESTKDMQRNWIGKSEGAEIIFDVDFEKLRSDGTKYQTGKIPIFTTRPDTLFGATYMVLAPEHLWVTLATDDKHDVLHNKEEVKKYVEVAKNKTEIERTALGKEKTGVKLEGVYATNPANGEHLPIYVADYVLGNYGTGAIMAVPAHDERDFEFAKKYNIPVKQVVQPVRIDKNNPHVEGYEVVERNMVHGIIRDPKTNKYLMLNWTSNPWTTFVLGGTEEGEDGLESVLREIKEETGLSNLKFLYKSITAYSEYCANHKKQNRVAHPTAYFFEVTDETVQDEISKDENAKHTIEWIDLSKGLPKNFTCSEWDIFSETIKHKGFYVSTEPGKLMNSREFDGMDSEEAKRKITEFVGGKMVTKYKLKDWVFARQRYWGEPFPIVFDENHKSYVVADSELPVVLPDVESYEPTGTGEGPLADIKDWVEVYGKINAEGEFVTCLPREQGGKTFYRETNTMPQWAGSSWYWLRYMDPHNDNRLVGVEEEKYWSSNGNPVDMYIGGMEHATRHLIYGRFWNEFLYDIGVVTAPEPFKRLETVGLVLGHDGTKMSKRLGNIVNPDEIVERFGADTLRAYIAFAAPFGDSFSWDEKAIIGPRRFIERVWSLQYKLADENFPKSDEIETLMHQTIKKVGEDYERLQFNTAISQMMIFVNAVEKFSAITKENYTALLKLLAPVCPFVTEEIWNMLGENGSIHHSSWPIYDPAKIMNKNVNIAVQINGKLRDVFEAPVDLTDEEAISRAKETEGYKKWIGEHAPKKIIVVKNKIVNIVA